MNAYCGADMRLEFIKTSFHSPAKVVASNALNQRFGLVITGLVLFVVEGCTLIQGPRVSPAPADTTSSQPAVIETPVTPSEQPTPPVRPKASAKGDSTKVAKLPQTGEASWYGPKFHGKTTASGETYDQEALTAAHASLPFGSKVKVTNLSNGKSVEVEITDRGPFAENRIIDVSRAAAKALEMKDSGTTKVRLEPLPGQ
jgi:rare lipoprotein A (peptidoglycan hydrolase)